MTTSFRFFVGLSLALACTGSVAHAATVPPDDTTAGTTSGAVASTTTTTTTVPPTVPPSSSVPATQVLTTDPAPTTVAPAVEAVPTTTLPAPIPPAQLNVKRPRQLEYILATIRQLESRSTYDIPPNRGGASGAYQYIDSTWANYGGFPQAYLAPPWVQDHRAAADVEAILRRWNNDVSMVPIIWYYPAAATNPALLDVVPMPQAGNVLTVREYQRRWLEILADLQGKPPPLRSYPLPPLMLLSGIPPLYTPVGADAPVGAPIESPIEVVFPVLGPAAVAPPESCEGVLCGTAHEAIVFGRKLQPVVAITDGVVTKVQHGDPSTGAVRLTITDQRGISVHYTGFNDDNPGTDDGAAPPALRLTAHAQFGRTVRAGQIIGFLGDSDPEPVPGADPAAPRWPHIRIAITDVLGQPVDAQQPVVFAQLRQQCTVGIGPWTTPPHPDLVDSPMNPVVVPAGVDDTDGPVAAGQWVIGRTGQVTAVGAAALVYPTDGCLWAPLQPFGSGAGGATIVPQHWWGDIDLPTEVWIAATMGSRVTPVEPPRRG